MTERPNSPPTGPIDPEDQEVTGSSPTFAYSHQPGFPELLERLGITLLVTTYQAGKLITLRAREGRMSMLLRTFDKAMGLAVGPGTLALATRSMIWLFRDSPSVAKKLNATAEPGTTAYDACYLPRTAMVTGVIDTHEVAFGRDGQIWLVNTHFSCLATLDSRFSFVPRWKPQFISKLAREDRCHLNGMAIVDGTPRYVTCFGQTDTYEGWRPGKRDGGVILEVPSGRIVAEGLAMPHSPRFHERRLWVLDSGRGTLCQVDPASGQTTVVAELDGYTRGLAFAGPLAFVGLSKVRETATFGEVPITEMPGERPCGVVVVDTRNGQILTRLDFLEDIREVFDVQIIPHQRWPMVAGTKRGRLEQVSVVGPEQPFPA